MMIDVAVAVLALLMLRASVGVGKNGMARKCVIHVPPRTLGIQLEYRPPKICENKSDQCTEREFHTQHTFREVGWGCIDALDVNQAANN